MFCFSRANHASTKFEKGFELKTSTSLLYLPIWKYLETCCVNFFFAWADILSEKNPYFGKHLFCKTKTDYAYKLRVQDFATSKNFSFNQCSYQERFAFFSRESYFIKAIENFFPVFKHSRGWVNSRQLCKPSASSRVCMTVSNSPNPSSAYIRLCEHRKRFLLLN